MSSTGYAIIKRSDPMKSSANTPEMYGHMVHQYNQKEEQHDYDQKEEHYNPQEEHYTPQPEEHHEPKYTQQQNHHQQNYNMYQQMKHETPSPPVPMKDVHGIDFEVCIFPSSIVLINISDLLFSETSAVWIIQLNVNQYIMN